MARFDITVDGVPEFSRAFNRAADKLDDLSPVWEEVKEEFFEIEREQFISLGKDGAGGAWAELKEPYATIKARTWGDKDILERTGELYRSLTQEGGQNVTEIRKREAAFGTSVPYARHHQYGAPGANVARREVISFSESQKNRLMKRIQRKLVEEMRDAGLMKK